MRSTPHPIYLLLHKDYFETLDAYTSEVSEFCSIASSRLPPLWSLERHGIWAHCSSQGNITPRQGWKIHISARPVNASVVLSSVTEVLFQQGAANFKFAADPHILGLMNSKGWPREAAGKFITIYPPDNHRFLFLAEEIYRATKGLNGPYVLSDHRYKDSEVVFYRYGGMQPLYILNVKGERLPALLTPTGDYEPDYRVPYPFTPSWADTPLPLEPMIDQIPEGRRLKGGKYRIDHAISFSNSGGVYCAVDNETNLKIVIKEARPWINETDDGSDAIELLQKEYRILNVLADADIAPQPIDLFQEWEHWFLVEEYIDGVSVNVHVSEHNVLLRTRADSECRERCWHTFISLAHNLIDIVATLHERAIIFGDLSPRNLLFVPAKGHIKLIDFETACQIGVDRPTAIHTPGFASPNRVAGGPAQIEDDYYGVGAVLLSCLFPVNSLLSLNPDLSREFLASLQADIGLPQAVTNLLLNLLNPYPSRRPEPAAMHAVFASISVEEKTVAKKPVEDYPFILDRIVEHIHKVATYDRRDRLFPSDPNVFATNPLSLAYGASGVIYAVFRMTGKLFQAGIDWILSHEINPYVCPPGLYVGLSGIAWALLEIGCSQEAEKIFQLTFGHPLLHAAPDIFYGLAGWGMACLRFFMATGNQLYMDQAIYAGRKLLEMRTISERGAYWELLDEVRLGFAHGATGISFFLLLLYLLTSESDFLATGQEGLRFDLSFGIENKDGGLSWASSLSDQSILYSYWRFGSAGIGAVVLRFWRLLDDPFYSSILEKVFIDTDRKYAILPGRFIGLAGIGDFLMDMHEFTGSDIYLQSARKVAEGLMLFKVEREGTAFPGDLLCRLCCDYGTGSAGIGLFLARLHCGTKTDFMLDSLFKSKCVA